MKFFSNDLLFTNCINLNIPVFEIESFDVDSDSINTTDNFKNLKISTAVLKIERFCKIPDNRVNLDLQSVSFYTSGLYRNQKVYLSLDTFLI